jgi:hypothetical protein|tara:strand:- start:414 stop:596 length:183 start_codon:yes stop_codon:yes gene_type:complete
MKQRINDFGYNPSDWAMKMPALAKLLAKWKKERGYDPIKNPEARYHINDPVLRELRKKKK